VTRVSEGSIRVFEIGRGGDRADLEVELPASWARPHSDVAVVFVKGGPEFGWHAHVVGDERRVLLSFPWNDRVDKALIEEDCGLPAQVDEAGWDDLEQGWWARVIASGADVYLAETDFDLMTKVSEPRRIAHRDPGTVLVDDVPVR
jgi:hypothetical protein